MIDSAVPEVCPGCSQPCERFLFEHGTRHARVLWECDHCGQTDTCMVSPDFGFARSQTRAYTLS